MSLNGLDSQPIQDAYQTAIAEPGGWFLMKYCSRDAVDLLAQGKSGVNGARNAIAKYEEASPLYGLLIYRRRRVLIKFIPDGTSRLLQARTAVHFQDVLERYSPYETLLEITNSESLNDTSLASAFPLHTASASPAASSNRLDEISEDAEDGGNAPINRALKSNAQRHKPERRMEQIAKPDRPPPPIPDRLPPSIRVTGDAPPSPTSSSMKRPAISQFLVREDLGHTSIRSLDPVSSVASVTEYTASDTSSVNRPDSIDRPKFDLPSTNEVKTETSQAPAISKRNDVANEKPSTDPEPESMGTSAEQSNLPDAAPHRARTSTSVSDKNKYEDDPYDFSKFEYKPKVKLGPRPVASADMSKRPTTASIAGVPSHYRPSAPKKQEPTRPKSQGTASIISTASATHSTLPAPPPIPAASDYNPRPVSRGSVKSMPTHKSTAMTPDKIRLMKAVELRKRQLRKSTPQESFQPPKEEDLANVPPLPDLPEKSVQREPLLGDETVAEIQNAAKKPDSGIGIQYDKPEDVDGQKLTQDAASSIPLPAEANSKASDGQSSTEIPSEVEPMAEPSIPTSTNVPDEIDPLLSADTEALQVPASTDPEPQAVEDSAEPELELTPVPTLVTGDFPSSQLSIETTKLDEAYLTAEEDQKPSDDDDASITRSEDITPVSPKRQGNELAKKRRGVVEPLQIDVSPSGNPDDFLSDDDDFLEELRTAPVEQAKPVQVAKAPASGDSLGRRPSTASGVSEAGASVKSIRIKKSTAAIIENSSRISPEPPQVPHYMPTGMWDKHEPAAGTGLARNVSSGISKRIQRLAEVSSRESILARDNAPSRPLTPETSPNAFLQRDQRERTAMVRNAHKGRPVSFRRQSSKSSGGVSPSPISPNENAPFVSVQRDAAGNRNSVSVSARIVRPNAPRDTSNANSKFQQSDLKISTTPTSPQRRPSYTQAPESVTSSATSPGALSPPLSPISTESRGTTRFNRKQSTTSPSPDDFPPPPTSRPGTSPEESASTKEGGSRTSRFLKRMSNFGGGGKRKSGPQRTSAASSIPSNDNMPNRAAEPRPAPPTEKPDTPPAVVVGDLNVQFPDSLLWKRRIVTIDENGSLQFAIAQAMDIHKSVAIKKFHLADFKLPYAPDLDFQELPHSVVLEFGDGTTLQVACEDSMTHRQVLHLLKTHWKAWAQPS